MNASGPGFVSLVGAGPGHPDYLTMKAVRRLREAHLVLYDALVADSVVEIAAQAECRFVGKRARRAQTPQHAIHEAMIDAAYRGHRVVRLKGGDPFVFGRGGEEALALQSAGVAFEIVPGVSAAVAAAGLAGIPVTHRGLAAGVLVINGSNDADVALSLGSPAAGPVTAAVTVVAMMAVANRAAVARALLARGWPALTPAAIILGAATPRMWTWRGALDELGEAAIPADRDDLPGTLVVGAVAGLPIPAAAPNDFEPLAAREDDTAPAWRGGDDGRA